MATTWNTAWPVISLFLSVSAGIIGGLVLFNLTGLKDTIREVSIRQESHNRDLLAMKDRMAACKQDCDRNTVSKEDWVREVGYSRKLGEQQIRELAEIKAHMSIIEKLPEIIGQITRNIASELRKG